MKIFVVLLFLALPVTAQDIWTVDTLQWDAISANVIDAVGWSNLPALRSEEKDTTRWYIETIGEKCDMAYKKIWLPTQTDGLYEPFYERGIKCKIDTIWAEKIQVWLTPVQLNELMELFK